MKSRLFVLYIYGKSARTPITSWLPIQSQLSEKINKFVRRHAGLQSQSGCGFFVEDLDTLLENLSRKGITCSNITTGWSYGRYTIKP
jgi:hypothetical protein